MDDSDEGHKCGPSCSNNNGGCQHLCHPLPSGRTCSCNPGFVLDNNGRDC
ncbi:Low-density lipoprotein receptor-related protein 1-like 4, partial [Homarus americanus]